MRYGRAAAAVLVAAAALTTAASPAGAKTTLQRQVDQVLRHAAPGARQIAPNRVTWPGRGVTVTLSAPGKARAAAGPLDCPVGYACLWQDSNWTSRRVQFYRYGKYRLAAYGMPPGTRRGAKLLLQPTDGRRVCEPPRRRLHLPDDRVREYPTEVQRPGSNDLARSPLVGTAHGRMPEGGGPCGASRARTKPK